MSSFRLATIRADLWLRRWGIFLWLCGAGAIPLPALAASPHELTALPVVGGNSDIGFGGGYIISYARSISRYDPYLIRWEAAGFVTLRRDESQWRSPYLDQYLLMHLPQVIPKQLELLLRASYTRESNLKYYGLGNASEIAAGRDPESSFFEYLRAHPTLASEGLYRFTSRWGVIFGLGFTYNTLTVGEDTQLSQDTRFGTPKEQRLLRNGGNHARLLFSSGARYDSRDNQANPSEGQFHELKVTGAPAVWRMPHGFVRVTQSYRAYTTLVPNRLVGAGRLVVEALLLRPPFYELARYDDSFAIGGVKGVRGIRGQRYYGKTKVFSNWELRSHLSSFNFWGKINVVGATVFFDVGRVWATYPGSSPRLDGRGVGLKSGLGAGLRLIAGESFVLRGDVAWSPQADGVGAYLIAGNTF